MLQAGIVVVLLACLIGIPLWNAAAHYGRGVRAIKEQAYARAANEFAHARVLFFPYRDATILEETARRAVNAEADDVLRRQTGAPILSDLEKASEKLKANDANGLLAVIRSIDANDLQSSLNSNAAIRKTADSLATRLIAASRAALNSAAWARAGRLTAALILLQPSNKVAANLDNRAQEGQELSAKLTLAKDAARRGRWREALNLAVAVLAVRRDFPGAAAMAVSARRALAPKPVATSSSSRSTSRSTTSRPASQPAPP